MKLKRYLRHLTKLAQDNPKALEMNVIYSSDSEGNNYDDEVFLPTMGKLHDDGDFEIASEEDANRICIN